MADMFNTVNLETATLAAAIIIARGATTVKEIQKARVDAGWLTSPAPSDSSYKAWQIAHDLTPTTAAEDQATAAAIRAGNKMVVGGLQL